MVLCLSTFNIPADGFDTIDSLFNWCDRLDDLRWDDYTAPSAKLLDAYGLDVDEADNALSGLDDINATAGWVAGRVFDFEYDYED